MEIVNSHPSTIGPDDLLPRIWTRSYYKSFDGIRGVAIGMVFLCHAGNSMFGERAVSALWIGVDLFFVLSGFLITGILYDSLNDPHFFRNFYVRRSLRIFPIFYGFFLAVLLLTPFLHLRYEPGLFTYALYFGNVFTPLVPDIMHHNPTVITGMLHGHSFELNIGLFWSLCVEEQFYLTWPLLVYLVRSRKALMGICVAGCLGIPLFRVALVAFSHWHHSVPTILFYWSPITRADTLLWGALGALWLRQQPLSKPKIRRISTLLFAVPTILILLAGISSKVSYGPASLFMRTIGFTLIALASLGIILGSLDDDSVLARCLRFRPLAYLGAISYGFYVYHGLLIVPMRGLVSYGYIPGPWAWTLTPIAFAATLAVSIVSFRLLESPFLRLKSRLAPQGTGSAHQGALLHVPQPQPAE